MDIYFPIEDIDNRLRLRQKDEKYELTRKSVLSEDFSTY